MTEPGWSEVLAEHREDEGPAERAARRARQAAERDDHQAAQAEAERAGAIEDERERRQMTYQVLGIAGRSASQVLAEAGHIGDEDAEYAEAEKTIERIGRRRAARADAMRYEAEQIAMASRAQIPADPYEAAAQRAHRAFRAATRAKINEAITGQPVSRPKDEAGRSHGVAVRADAADEQQCAYCTSQGVDAQTSFLLHNDPERPVPVTTAEQAEQAEANRLMRLGYSRDTAQYAAAPLRGGMAVR